MSTEQFLISAWSWNPLVLFSGAAALGAYVFAFGFHRRSGFFAAGLVVFLLALLSPLSTLADGYLFSAHMVQHILLLLIVPALLLLGLPRSVSLSLRPRFLSHPILGWIAGVGAMWVWHWPTLCNAAVSSPAIFALQSSSLVLLGALFWRQILAPREEERLSPPGAVIYLFTACVGCSVLGMILTFSPVTVCSIYSMPPPDRFGVLATTHNAWGLTPERDQQVGGLLMWVPMCLIYLAAIFAQIVRWFGEVRPQPMMGRTL